MTGHGTRADPAVTVRVLANHRRDLITVRLAVLDYAHGICDSWGTDCIEPWE